MDRRRWLVVIAVDLAMSLAALDSTVIGTAMPTVVASLGGLDIFSWSFSVYLLTSTAALPIFGSLSDRYGRRAMFVLSVWIFTLASALCGAATSMVALIAARALQGIGAGGSFAMAQAVFGEIFAPKDRGRMQGYLAAVWGISALIGPLIGGLIVQHLSWRWTFFINLPVGVAANFMLMKGLSGMTAGPVRRPIDYAGAGCLVAGIVSLMLSLLEFGRGGSAWIEALAGLTIAVVCGLLFLVIENRVRAPILPLGLFSNRLFTTTNTCLFLSGLAMFGAVSFIPLFIQAVLGGTALQAGSVLTPTSLCWVAGGTLGGRLVNRLGYRSLAVAGMCCLATGYFLFTRLDPLSQLHHAAVSGMVLGFGMGLITVTTVVATQTTAPQGQIGIVTSLPFFFRNIGATIGVAVMGTILNASLVRAGVGALAIGSGEGAFAAVSAALRAHIATGLRAAFYFGLTAVTLGIAVSLLVPNLSPTRAGGTARLSSSAEALGG